NTVSGARSFSTDSKTITVTPTTALADGTYAATSTAKDAAGNTTTTSWSFTVDGTPPANTATAPTAGSAGPASTVSATYGEALDQAASAIRLRDSPNAAVLGPAT